MTESNILSLILFALFHVVVSAITVQAYGLSFTTVLFAPACFVLISALTQPIATIAIGLLIALYNLLQPY